MGAKKPDGNGSDRSFEELRQWREECLEFLKM